MNQIDLFCLPYAGGSANAIYGKWVQELDSKINMHPLEMAGHGKRMSEPLQSGIEEVVRDMFKNIHHRILKYPYAIYAHSMGTVVAYELVAAIRNAGLPQPRCLFLSGRLPPDHKYESVNKHSMSKEDFLQEIQKIGGTPEGLFQSQELMEIFLPILRNDYRIIEKYNFSAPEVSFDSDIVFFHSNKDCLVSKPEIFEWNRYTDQSFAYYEFNGGHFFLNEVWKDIVSIINKKLYY